MQNDASKWIQRSGQQFSKTLIYFRISEGLTLTILNGFSSSLETLYYFNPWVLWEFSTPDLAWSVESTTLKATAFRTKQFHMHHFYTALSYKEQHLCVQVRVLDSGLKYFTPD